MNIHAEMIAILDYGSQYTQLIARRVRECGVYCEILPFDIRAEDLAELNPAGVILSGGPESVTEGISPGIPAGLLDRQVPVLGICYGMQAMTRELGGTVSTADRREFGHAQIMVEADSPLFHGDPEGQDAAVEFRAGDERNVWMSHGDHILDAPRGFTVLASTASAPVAAMADEQRRLYGLQFHPEVTHTAGGDAILHRFVRQICNCQGLWTAGRIIDDAVEAVRAQVGTDQVLLGLSGGVDSSVVAALLQRAIGDQLICVFVDNGLLRLGEGDQVVEAFERAGDNSLDINVIKVDASATFYEKLHGIDDPEAKRRVIGATFIDVFEAEAKKHEGVRWLAQGTIYPDVIESAASKYGGAHVIKSHHNVGGLPERMELKLVEPLRELFKDEVRRIGTALGLPDRLVQRHPFPGPGLGVRILGEVKAEYAEVLRRADHIFIEELRNADLYDAVSQAFAVFLPVRSVGVVGDARRYAHVISLRAVVTTDFMTADWARLPDDLLATVSRRIINEIEDVSRVVYDISSKPPATIEWE